MTGKATFFLYTRINQKPIRKLAYQKTMKTFLSVPVYTLKMTPLSEGREKKCYLETTWNP